MTSIFLDANVFMYALGSEHPLRQPSWRILDLATTSDNFYTDAEVMQELLHRYLREGRWAEFKPFAEALHQLMEGHIVAMMAEDTREAGLFALHYPALSARDLIHYAIMRRVGATHIASADKDFDSIEGIERLDPLLIDEWQERVINN